MSGYLLGHKAIVLNTEIEEVYLKMIITEDEIVLHGFPKEWKSVLVKDESTKQQILENQEKAKLYDRFFDAVNIEDAIEITQKNQEIVDRLKKAIGGPSCGCGCHDDSEFCKENDDLLQLILKGDKE